MKNTESRYFNTAVKMDEAFIALLEHKDFDFITVKEICEKAGVNRSTFYLHYETIGDLLQESISYVNKKCFDRFPVPDFEAKIHSASLEELILVTPEFLLPYLEFVRENKTIFKTTVTRASTLGGSETFERIFKKIIAPVLTRFHYPQDEIGYVTAFYINGLIAVIMEWIKKDCEEDIRKIMDVIIKVTIPSGNGILSLEQAKAYVDKKTATHSDGEKNG